MFKNSSKKNLLKFEIEFILSYFFIVIKPIYFLGQCDLCSKFCISERDPEGQT